MGEEKRFAEWMRLKERLHATVRPRGFSERQVWWAAVGENVQVEINGKNERFSRPVLVFRKLSEVGFLGIPLTTQAHDKNSWWYVPFKFPGMRGKISYAVLSQARVFSVARLCGKSCIGTLTKREFDLVCKGFDRLYCEPHRKKFDPNR